MSNQPIEAGVTSPAAMRRNCPEESGHQLLKRILENRRAKWEAHELEQMQGQGKRLHRDEWKKKYKEPAAIEEIPSASIPESWVWASAETVCESVRDGTHDTPEYVLEGVPLVTSKNLTNGSIDFDDTKLISKEDHVEISKRSGVENGDVLFAMIGTVGNPLVVGTDREFSIKNVGLFKKNDAFLDSKFLKFWLDSPMLEKWLEPRLKGTTQKFAPLGLLRSLPVPVAPLEQQKRIVAEIEKQFSRLAEAVANLKRVKANLKRYKAAVLKAAVEGKLTEVWRKAHPDVEPASELLKRILAERRAKWSGKGKYKEPSVPYSVDLPPLPEGWVWATVDQLAAAESNSITDGPFGSNLKTSHYTSQGPRVVRLQNIGDGVFIDEHAHISSDHFEELSKHHIFAGDLVIAALGENLPRACVISGALGPAMVKADCVRFKPNPNLSSQYLNYVLNAQPTRVRTKAIVHGVGRPRLNLAEIKSIIVPVPPATEQERMVDEVDQRLSIVQEVDGVISANFQRAERLKQASLRGAFSGKLFGQLERST